MLWARLLAYVTGTVKQELLLRNEYLATENRILRGQIKGRLLLSEGEKGTLAEIAHRLGRKVLEDVAAAAKPDTILGWYRKLIANKFDGSKFRRSVGRPKVDLETERLVVRMARENPSWGYDRIVGALANLGHRLSDQTVGNIRRRDIPPAPQRKKTTSWKDFIRSHRDVLVGMDFFTTEVLTLKGLTTYYVLFFIHLETRRMNLAGFTPYPDEEWMEQQARNVTMEEWGCLRGCRYLLHDRDAKFCQSFRELIKTGSVNPLRLPENRRDRNTFSIPHILDFADVPRARWTPLCGYRGSGDAEQEVPRTSSDIRNYLLLEPRPNLHIGHGPSRHEVERRLSALHPRGDFLRCGIVGTHRPP
jgi:putative transposase